MDNIKLIDEIDQALGTIDASRAAHAEIQGYMKYFRQQTQMQQAPTADNKQHAKTNSKNAKTNIGE